MTIINTYYANDKKIPDNVWVCELHFNEHDITAYASRKMLSPTAVPLVGAIRTLSIPKVSAPAKTSNSIRNPFLPKTVQRFKKPFIKPTTLPKSTSFTTFSVKSPENTLEIIEIDENSYQIKRKPKFNSETNGKWEIIELDTITTSTTTTTSSNSNGNSSQRYQTITPEISNESTTTPNDNGFLMGHQLFSLKKFANN
ncbi:uncharacterized protein LOC128952341 isoform X2 [Oppia nitens]|nr:uncharacterized protein LOC128952341 isoform X2 [Oppia nitens]